MGSRRASCAPSNRSPHQWDCLPGVGDEKGPPPNPTPTSDMLLYQLFLYIMALTKYLIGKERILEFPQEKRSYKDGGVRKGIGTCLLKDAVLEGQLRLRSPGYSHFFTETLHPIWGFNSTTRRSQVSCFTD